MSEEVRALEPQALWNNFADLNEIPRGSKKEEKVIEFMKNFGEGLGLDTYVDDQLLYLIGVEIEAIVLPEIRALGLHDKAEMVQELISRITDHHNK